ncbi:ribosome biogenesis GTPase YqeH [Fervidibacillus halotolerans]|uniref:Ribosome biogenesis GTPase YqeH n=1 Tax=Fervidibacillus halotolerans TaxID=2980027 RepID=A0A9E8LZF3_9BACI|nr:ribosome biogenesis GTPase YqeH [Fervidibacillus halotolerans]WAA11529.1 ribosome biogenesis GTPase YqeH [Fervidibacillus halotolerans]
MENEWRCIGCGVKLQTEHPDEIGYTPKSSIGKESVLCQRCFRLKHYNEVRDVQLSDDDFLNILRQIGESDGLVVKIVDIFDFHGSWLPGIHRWVRGDVLLLGNKMDLLPKSVNENKLIHWIRSQAKEFGLKPIDVALVSSAKGYNIQKVIHLIDHYRKGKDVYVIGATNVGKSTFINRIIKEVSGEEQVITTSYFPGTTLDMIEIPLDDGKAIYDTPGIINHHQMAHFVSKADLKIITPKKEIKPKVFQLNERQTLFFGGLARLDFIKGDRHSFVCYLSNELPIHRTKMEKADDLYDKHRGEFLSPPSKEYIDDVPPFDRHEFSIEEGKTDIVFSGLGWVTIPKGGVTVAVYVPKGVRIFIRKSLI